MRNADKAWTDGVYSLVYSLVS